MSLENWRRYLWRRATGRRWSGILTSQVWWNTEGEGTASWKRRWNAGDLSSLPLLTWVMIALRCLRSIANGSTSRPTLKAGRRVWCCLISSTCAWPHLTLKGRRKQHQSEQALIFQNVVMSHVELEAGKSTYTTCVLLPRSALMWNSTWSVHSCGLPSALEKPRSPAEPASVFLQSSGDKPDTRAWRYKHSCVIGVLCLLWERRDALRYPALDTPSLESSMLRGLFQVFQSLVLAAFFPPAFSHFPVFPIWGLSPPLASQIPSSSFSTFISKKICPEKNMQHCAYICLENVFTNRRTSWSEMTSCKPAGYHYILIYQLPKTDHQHKSWNHSWAIGDLCKTPAGKHDTQLAKHFE